MIKDLIGKRLKEIYRDDESIKFHCKKIFSNEEDASYIMHHVQDCCENVTIEEVIGDLNDLLYGKVLHAEEVSSSGARSDYESCTWTFYHIRTIKGTVTIRWFGSSNGYYSERVDFEILK